MYSRKQSKVDVTHPPRVVGASHTQLAIMRVQLRNLFDEDSFARKKQSIFGRAELDKEDADVLEKFYEDSRWYPYLLDYAGTIRSVSDLGDLWYREFYLEITKCIQFPIEMSMPWILTEHVIKNQASEVPMVENLLYSMDIYNDSAHRALYNLNQQYLYNEIEAEANLVFDQLIYLVSDEVYTYYKNVAAASCLDKGFKAVMENDIRKSTYLSVSKRRYETAMNQRNIHLLGRSIDLNFLIGQHLNNKLHRDLEAAILKFEASDVTGCIELEAVLRVIRHTHEALSQHLQLDSFDILFHAVNESYSLTSFANRIVVHFLRCLENDLFNNYCFNMHTQRFTRAPLILKPFEHEKAPRHLAGNMLFGEQCGKSYEIICKMTKSFVGRVHWEAAIAVMGYSAVALIIDTCLKSLANKLGEIKAYMEALREGIPPGKHPQYMFRAGGCYGYFEGQLKGLLEYEDLKPEVFQGFREIGNILAFLLCFSETIDVMEQFRFISVAPVVGLSPSHSAASAAVMSSNAPPPCPLSQCLQNLCAQAQAHANAVTAPSVINAVPEMSWQLCSSFAHALVPKNIFRAVMVKVQDVLYQLDLISAWGTHPLDDGAVEVNSKEFFRLFSALNFLFCMPNEHDHAADSGDVLNVPDSHEFGDGFAFAGCALLHLLDQRHVFELLDAATYVLRVRDHEGNSVTAANAQVGTVDESLKKEMEQFVVVAEEQKRLQTDVFLLLESYYPTKGDVDGIMSATTIAQKKASNIRVCRPPTD